jgi:hypothetical protein
MFIGQIANLLPTPFGGAEFQLELYYSRTIPLLRTEPEEFCFLDL